MTQSSDMELADMDWLKERMSMKAEREDSVRAVNLSNKEKNKLKTEEDV